MSTVIREAQGSKWLPIGGIPYVGLGYQRRLPGDGEEQAALCRVSRSYVGKDSKK